VVVMAWLAVAEQNPKSPYFGKEHQVFD